MFEQLKCCSVAIKVTSNDLELGVPIEIAIVPLLGNCMPDPSVMPLSVLLKPPTDLERSIDVPGFPGFILASKAELLVASERGTSYDQAMNLIEKWFFRLELGNNERMVPLGFAYPILMTYLSRWMGGVAYSEMFHWIYRDVLPVAMYGRDQTGKATISLPTIGTLFSAANINTDRQMDCMSVAVETARLYSYTTNHIPSWWETGEF